jgi:hypothetical protein
METLYAAYAMAKKNNRAPGIDGVTEQLHHPLAAPAGRAEGIVFLGLAGISLVGRGEHAAAADGETSASSGSWLGPSPPRSQAAMRR